MDSGGGKTQRNVQGDRLSSLPDDLILKILSFIDTKHAIRTSVLSYRWRYIWTSTPRLDFSTRDFRTLAKFSKFVTGVLSGRKNQIEVSSVKFTLIGRASQAFNKRILNKVLNYALSHNVQQLNITCRHGCESLLSRFSSQSLKHLTLMGLTYKNSITTPPTWDMLALTTLNLYCITLYADNIGESACLFSNCANLKNLTLNSCRMGWGRFNICHPRLSNLTLENSQEGGDVVAPQLKNLTIRNWRGIHLISAPKLASLQYEGHVIPLKVSAELLHLEMVDICLLPPVDSRADVHEVVCLLQKLHSVKCLKLNPEIIRILCLHVELISHQSSPFANLKSLKIHPKVYPGYYIPDEEQTQPKVTMCTEVKNYFLDGSPGATFKMVSHEDIRARKKTMLGRKLITDLQALLEQEKASIETKMVKMHEQEKAHIDIDSCWKYMSRQIKKAKEKTSDIISKLKEIKELLGELPASNRDIIQPSFSNLCAEADIVINKITDCTKMQCDENQRRLSVCVHELATTLQPSS